MRILFLCDEYPPGNHGGIGTMVRTLARGLVRAGHEVRVLGSYDTAVTAPGCATDGDVQLWRVPKHGGPVGWLRERMELRRLVQRWCRDGTVDIVEVSDWGGPAAGWPRLPVPVVARLNGSATFFAAEMGRPVNSTTRLLESRSLRRVDCWASTSQYTAVRTRALFDLPTDAAAVLPNAVDLPASDHASRSARRIVYTGTLTAKKGVRQLIEAWPLVMASVPDAELHLYGKDGRGEVGESMREELLRRLPWGVLRSVTFHGHVGFDELSGALTGARAAIFPSYAEAFAHGPLEAMATGCPTVYTSRGSGPELITVGLDGLLIDPDDRGAIADALVRLLTDDELAGRLGRAGRATIARRFSTERLVEDSARFYEMAVEKFRISRRRHATIA